jgi:hypothetical protein
MVIAQILATVLVMRIEGPILVTFLLRVVCERGQGPRIQRVPSSVDIHSLEEARFYFDSKTSSAKNMPTVSNTGCFYIRQPDEDRGRISSILVRTDNRYRTVNLGHRCSGKSTSR